MALSDCPRCWETPCTCGLYFAHYNREERIKQAAAVLGIKTNKLRRAIHNIVPTTHPLKFRGTDWRR